MVSIRSSKKKRDWQNEMLLMIRCSVLVGIIALYAISFLLSSQSNDLLNEAYPNGEIKIDTTTVDASIVPTQQEFVKKNCQIDFQNWQIDASWETRAPLFLIIGAKKCGTTSILSYLAQHPHAVRARSKELLFFIPHRFEHWENPGDFDSKVLVGDARDKMYQNDYNVSILKRYEKSFSFEATPDYLLYSTYSAKAILCTIPWVKIVVILRNPVDRVFSHYNFLQDSRLTPRGYKPPSVSFDAWVRGDLGRLREYGVIRFPNRTKSFFGSQEEKDAWNEYQNVSNSEAHDRPLARGLYALQLEGWFEALRSIGRDPKSTVLILRQEELKKNPSKECNKIFEWLGVEPIRIEEGHDQLVTAYKSELNETTRKLLENFYKPYNQRLYNILGKEWEGVWDPITSNDELSPDVAQDQTVSSSIAATPKVPSLSLKQKSFLSKHCKIDNETSWWMDNGDPNVWQRRAPYFLLIGAKKAGTTSLFAYLSSHPQVVLGGTGSARKELHSFHPNGRFQQWDTVEKIGMRVDVDLARRQMYEKDYLDPRIHSDPNVISFDATPDYLLYSSFSPKAILCTVPWVKILVSLRNPIDRLFSNYNFLMDYKLMPAYVAKNRKNYTLEESMEIDMNELAVAGLIQDKIPQKEFWGSQEERDAWRRYQLKVVKMSPADRMVGRSMYAIQLEEWFDWFREADRDPSDIMVVTEEELASNASDVVNRIVDWLDLPPHKFDTTKKIMVTHYTAPPIEAETRAMLQTFFDPYNKRLRKLLGPKWDKWDGS